MLGFPYRIAKAIGTEVFCWTLDCKRSDNTMSGEPSSHQIFLYAFADRRGRVFRIIPFTKKVRNHFGKSMTRSSIKNSSRYGLTSLGSGLSGDPKLTSNTPFIAFFYEDNDIIYFLGVVPYFFLKAAIKWLEVL